MTDGKTFKLTTVTTSPTATDGYLALYAVSADSETSALVQTVVILIRMARLNPDLIATQPKAEILLINAKLRAAIRQSAHSWQRQEILQYLFQKWFTKG